jgi:hypothetical protein
MGQTNRSSSSVAAVRACQPAVESLESRQFLSASPAAAAWAAKGVHLTAYEDSAYHGAVATFKADLATFDLALHVNVNWGDGSTTGGRIVPNAKGGYDVVGTHAYADDGKYDVEVVITAGPPTVPGQPNPFFVIRLADVHSVADVKDLRPVSLHQSNHIADLGYDINVNSNGLLTFSGPTIRTRPVQLTEAQEDKLRAVFADWDQLARNYPNPAGSFGVGSTTISYGSKTVTAGDEATGVPQAFKTVQSLLKKLAGLA